MHKMETYADVKGVEVRSWNRPSEEDMDLVPLPLRRFTRIFANGMWLDKKMIRALAPILSEQMFKCPIDYLWKMSDWEDYAKLYPPQSKQVPPPPPPYESTGYHGWEIWEDAESFNDVLERFKGTRLIKSNYNEPGHVCKWQEIKVRKEETDKKEVCEPEEVGW